jgi:hypothetical protein
MIGSNFSATRAAAFTFGVFGGLLGLEHGYFEVLQGNVAPSSIVIRAMGAPCQPATAQNGCEPAMTVIPNLLLTGILTIIVSLLIITWASMLIQKRNAGFVLTILSISLLFVGGGFTPIPFGILAGIAGTGMNSSPTWWQAHLSDRAWRALAKLWPWPLIASVIWYLGLFIFGSNTVLGALGLVLCLLAVLIGFVHDSQRQVGSYQIPSIGG